MKSQKRISPNSLRREYLAHPSTFREIVGVRTVQNSLDFSELLRTVSGDFLRMYEVRMRERIYAVLVVVKVGSHPIVGGRVCGTVAHALHVSNSLATEASCLINCWKCSQARTIRAVNRVTVLLYESAGVDTQVQKNREAQKKILTCSCIISHQECDVEKSRLACR